VHVVTVACCELAPEIGRVEANIDRVTAAVRSAAAAGADLVVLPELVTSGYCFDSVEEARASALPADSRAFAQWSTIGPVVVAGFAEAADEQLYNSAILLDGDRRTVYRKTHLWDREKLFFTPGSAPPPVVGTRLGAVAVMVCYDLEFPEMTRSVATRGADVLAVPTNWPWVDRPAGMPAPEVVIAMGAARVNHLPIACCDRRGEERGQRWNQASVVIGADGWPIAQADGEGVAIARFDLAATRDKSVSPRNDLLADRRPELY
jgi:predicted amidohydrolase